MFFSNKIKGIRHNKFIEKFSLMFLDYIILTIPSQGVKRNQTFSANESKFPVPINTDATRHMESCIKVNLKR